MRSQNENGVRILALVCERLPEIAPRARKTRRVEEAPLAIASELGSRAGAREWLWAPYNNVVGRGTGRTRRESHTGGGGKVRPEVELKPARRALSFAFVVVHLVALPEEPAHGPLLFGAAGRSTGEDAHFAGVRVDHDVRFDHGREAQVPERPLGVVD